jgi:hypothetical protein
MIDRAEVASLNRAPPFGDPRRLSVLGAVNDRRFRVLDVVSFDEEDESAFVGLLQVEPA